MLALRSLCARSPGCGCFCLRLDFHVTVSVRGGQGSQPGFLVLAFSARTLKSSGVPARRVPAGGFCVGMLPLVCRTLACPGLLVVVRFRGVHDCCLLGSCFVLSKDPLVVKLSPPCWLAAVRGAGGAFGAEGSWLSLGGLSCFVCVSAVRLEVQRCSCFCKARLAGKLRRHSARGLW